MEPLRTYSALLVGFALGFIASNLLVVASMENARLRTQVDLLNLQVTTMRDDADAREARLGEIIAAVDEQLDQQRQ
jgi:hypothetical protein